MRCARILALLLASVTLVISGESRAQTVSYGVGSPLSDRRSPFWREVVEPGHSRSRVLLRHGLNLLALSSHVTDPRERAVLIDGAIARLSLARERSPDDPEVTFYLAVSTAAFERPRIGRPPERRDAAAIELFLDLRRIDPDWRAAQVAFELGILYTRLHRYPEAAEEYGRAIGRSFDESEMISTHSNLAEVSMLHGDLEVALSHYERAIELARAAGPAEALSFTLALFGSAVALDRLGEEDTALERARDALSAGGASTQALHASGVFFEPASELHYYEGLAHLAQAETASGEGARVAYRDAVRSWERFLIEGGALSAWASLAEAHLERARRGAR